MQVSSIRLSDRTSRLPPRRAAATLGQTYETEVPVEVREWINPASASPDLVFGPQPRPLPSAGVTRLQRYYGPLRHPTPPGLSLAGVRLIIPDHAMGLPVLRALSLCTCCRHYPGAAAGRTLRSSHPAVSAFPGRVAGSARTLSFSRLARRSLTLRPAHSRGHRMS